MRYSVDIGKTLDWPVDRSSVEQAGGVLMTRAEAQTAGLACQITGEVPDILADVPVSNLPAPFADNGEVSMPTVYFEALQADLLKAGYNHAISDAAAHIRDIAVKKTRDVDGEGEARELRGIAQGLVNMKKHREGAA